MGGRRQARTVLGLCALVALIALVHARADAQGAGAALDLRVEPDPRGCVGDAALRARVQHYLSPRAQPAQVRIEVSASETSARFSVQRAGRELAERRFDVLPAACDARLDALALAIALAIEQATSPSAASAGASPGGAASGQGPTAVPAGPSGENGGQPSSAEPPDASEQNPPTAEAKPEPDRDDVNEDEPGGEDDDDGGRESRSAGGAIALRLSLGAGALLAVVPKPVFAGQAGLDLDLARGFGLRFVALYGRAGAVEIAEGRASSQLIAARALACLLWPAGEFALEGCGGAAGGVALASGKGDLSARKDAAMAWLAADLRAALRYPASSLFSLRVALDGQASAVRPKLRVDAPDEGDVIEKAPAPVGGAISLELVLALP